VQTVEEVHSVIVKLVSLLVRVHSGLPVRVQVPVIVAVLNVIVLLPVDPVSVAVPVIGPVSIRVFPPYVTVNESVPVTCRVLEMNCKFAKDAVGISLM
jgi:hypothetical protein